MAQRIIVVIPVFNEAAIIKDCLDALLLQTKQPDVVLIVDNNCTDNTIAVAEKYSFVQIVREKKQGICAATKNGFDTAANNCDIILRCDADSRPHPNWVVYAANHFAEHDDVALTGPGEFTELYGIKRWFADKLYMQMYFMSIGSALGQRPLFGSNFAILASTWRSISNQTHLDRQDLHDDIDISFHAATVGTIAYRADFTMPISARPFGSIRSFIKRYPIGLRSVTIHWPEQAPWRRR